MLFEGFDYEFQCGLLQGKVLRTGFFHLDVHHFPDVFVVNRDTLSLPLGFFVLWGRPEDGRSGMG